MKPPLPMPPLMIITNRHMTTDLTATVARALDGGARWILLREKDMAPSERHELAQRIKADTDRHDALFGINSDLATLQAIEGRSLHLPSDALQVEVDAQHLLLGASVHDAREAELAVEAGADYLLAAPIFETASKPLQRPPLGLAGLRTIAAAAPVPVVALGGIFPDDAADCLDSGAAGVATMGAVMRAGDPAAVVHAFLEAMR